MAFFNILSNLFSRIFSIFGGGVKTTAATPAVPSPIESLLNPVSQAVQAVGTTVSQTVSIPASGGKLSQAQVEKYAKLIVANFFPNVDWRMLVTMAYIESSFNPKAYRYESHIKDASYGLMQVLLGTAKWIYTDLGKRAYGTPTASNLYTPEQAMYYGAAYVNWLRTYKGVARSPEWIVRAYNGGPGWASTTNGKNMTLNHWTKYKKARDKLYGA